MPSPHGHRGQLARRSEANTGISACDDKDPPIHVGAYIGGVKPLGSVLVAEPGVQPTTLHS